MILGHMRMADSTAAPRTARTKGFHRHALGSRLHQRSPAYTPSQPPAAARPRATFTGISAINPATNSTVVDKIAMR